MLIGRPLTGTGCQLLTVATSVKPVFHNLFRKLLFRSFAFLRLPIPMNDYYRWRLSTVASSLETSWDEISRCRKRNGYQPVSSGWMTPFWSELDSSLLLDPKLFMLLQFIFTRRVLLFRNYTKPAEKENKWIKFPMPHQSPRRWLPTTFDLCRVGPVQRWSALGSVQQAAWWKLVQVGGSTWHRRVLSSFCFFVQLFSPR